MPARVAACPPQGRAPGPADADSPRDVTWEILSSHLNDLVVMADAANTIFYVSPACRNLGYAQHEMIGRGPADFVHPDDLDRFLSNTAALYAANTGAPDLRREHRVRCKDGSWIWMEGSPSLIRDSEGQPIGLINVFRDVSARVEVERKLEESERRYRLLTEHATDMVSQTSVSTGRLTFLSPAVERLTGYRVDELIGARMQDLVHPDDRADFLAAFTDLVSGRRESGQAIRFRARNKAGAWMWLESNPRLVRDEMGEPRDIIDMTRDVSQQQALQARLSEALAEAEKAAAVKSEFLANMSHELRTPLTAVLGFTSLLADRRDLGPEARAQVQRVAGASRALLAIVNDVLDFSKLEAGLVTINPRPTSPTVLASEVVELFERMAHEKGLAVSVQADPDAASTVMLDGDRLRQILVNLVSNAVKFTEHGEVRVSVSYDAAAARLAIEVADSGPGIAAAAREKLFQRFSQVDGSSTRAQGGTGLGLAISRKLAEAMGGEITLRSRVGRGSTFRVELPAPVAEEAAASDTGEAALDTLDGARVLVVDDNAVNRELARAILEPLGVEVSEACDGAEAVAAARLPVDLILMDLRMPGLNGRGAAEAVRRTPGPNQDIPILAFSADSEIADDPAGLGPFDGQVRKPVEPSALIRALIEALTDPYDRAWTEAANAHG
jgi:PAS domain S-box-containing protein